MDRSTLAADGYVLMKEMEEAVPEWVTKRVEPELLMGKFPVVVEHRWDEDGGSTRYRATVPLNNGVTRKQYRNALREIIGTDVDGRRCHHAYDCCANWYTGGLVFQRDRKLKTLDLIVPYYQNI